MFKDTRVAISLVNLEEVICRDIVQVKELKPTSLNSVELADYTIGSKFTIYQAKLTYLLLQSVDYAKEIYYISLKNKDCFYFE